MQESSVYQAVVAKARAEGIEQGIEIGRKAAAIEGILTILEVRFQKTLIVIKSELEAIDDTQRLKELYRDTARSPTLVVFLEEL